MWAQTQRERSARPERTRRNTSAGLAERRAFRACLPRRPPLYAPRALTATGTSRRHWNEGLLNIERFMRHYARLFVDDAPLYNPRNTAWRSPVTPNRASLWTATRWRKARRSPCLRSSIKGAGEARGGGGQRAGSTSNATSRFTFYAIVLLRQLWTIGAARYTETQPAVYPLFRRPLYRDVERLTHSPHTHTRMSFDLLYEQRPNAQ